MINGTLVALTGDGDVRWQTKPPPGPRWTTSSPVLDPFRQFVYSYALDGRVHKYEILAGDEVLDGRWPVLVTRKPEVEKMNNAASEFSRLKRSDAASGQSLRRVPPPRTKHQSPVAVATTFPAAAMY